MQPSTLELLKHINDEIKFCVKEMEDLSQEEFMKDEKLMRAVVRSLEIIGEASKKIPVDFKETYPTISWKEMAGMRDRLIHYYFGVDYEVVYKTIKNDLPPINVFLQNYL